MNTAIMTAIIVAGANNVNQNLNDEPSGSGGTDANLTLVESLILLGCIGVFAAVMALVIYFMLQPDFGRKK